MRQHTDHTHTNRTRGRRVNLVPVYLLVGVLLALVFTVLSLTVFFKLDTFSVSGDVPYAQERIIEVSGLEIGQNLIRLDENAAEQKILAELPYVETVKINVDLPATVTIELTAAAEYAYVPDGENFWIINSLGRVLKKSDMAYEGLIRLSGVLPPEKDIEDYAAEGNRTYVAFDDSRTKEAFSLLTRELSEEVVGKVTRIDTPGYLDVSFVVEDRVRVELGTVVDMEYKMKYVRRLFSDGTIPSEGYAILNVSNTERVSLKTNVTGDITIEDIFGEKANS